MVLAERKRKQIQLNSGAALGLLAVVVLGALTAIVGCDQKARPTRFRDVQVGGQSGLFESVVDNLDHMEQFDTTQIFKQNCDRLNQWYQQDRPTVAWEPDPLIATLPEALRDLAIMKTLDVMQFRQSDAWHIQEAIWLRDISKTARADQFDDLDVARALFDWTVRHIQLDPEVDPGKLINRHRPFETLLFGRGQPMERAWAFLLLCRQQGLEVVLLTTGEGDAKRLWLPALLSGGELYLFDTTLGLPIPGPEGKGVATLAQVLADEQLLRHMDLDAEHTYPVKADDLKHLAAYAEASPNSLSKRMALLESKLVGKHKVVLTARPSELAERLKSNQNLKEVTLWPLPFEIWQWQSNLNEKELIAAAEEMSLFQAMPELKVGRALSFKAMYDGEKGAKKQFLDVRPSNASIDKYKLPSDVAKQFRKEDISKVEALQVVMMTHAKQNASYWLGLMAFDEKDYPVAIDFFTKRTLEATPNGPWTHGARYNLARTYEASGEPARAIELYNSDEKSPQHYGNQLRAKWLKEKEMTK